jgi:hypothetical protein
MDFSYDNYNNISAQHASPSGRTPAPINYTHNFYLCRQAHKSRNHRPKKIFPSKQVGYLR